MINDDIPTPLPSERLEIRFKRAGCKNRANYNIMLCHIRRHRIKNHTVFEMLEHLGVYDPIPNRWGQKVCGLNVDRIKYWVACGATFDIRTRELLGLAGILPVSPDTYIRVARLNERQKMEDQAAAYLQKLDEEDAAEMEMD